MPYEQAILIPEPVWLDWSGALTADGERLAALETRKPPPLEPMAERARKMRRYHRCEGSRPGSC